MAAGGKGPNDRSRAGFDSGFEDTSPSGATPRPRAATPGQVARTSSSPAARRATSPSNPVARAPTPAGTKKPGIPTPLATQQAGAPAAPPGKPAPAQNEAAKAYHERRLASAFQDDDERTQIDAMLGSSSGPLPALRDDDDDDEPTSVTADFDGVTAPKELTSRDLWRAVNAPVQSREGRRSPSIYAKVIDQFAVGHNPRYEPDGPDRPRAHIFVWDVTRAMNAEVPHFLGAKELNLAQTCDWIRHEAAIRGWMRADASSALNAVNQGMPVLVLPKDIKVRLVAVARPGPPMGDGRPRVASAAKARGSNLTVIESLGVFAVEYFIHA